MKIEWTRAGIDALRACAEQGQTAAQAALKFNCSTATIFRRADDHGIEFPRYGRTWAEKEKSLLVDMAANGHGAAQIAEHLGRALGSVACKGAAMGVKFNQLNRRIKPRAKPNTKERDCLMGGHKFQARLNDAGRLLEYSCPRCQQASARDNRGAMI